MKTLYTIIDFDGTIADTVGTRTTTSSSFNLELFTGLLEFLQKAGQYKGSCDPSVVKSIFKGRSSYEALESLGIPEEAIQFAFSNVNIPISGKELQYIYTDQILRLLREDPNAYIVSDSFSRCIRSVLTGFDNGNIPEGKIYANDTLSGGKVRSVGKLPMLASALEADYIVFGDTDTDKEMAEAIRLTPSAQDILFVRTFSKVSHIQARYYKLLIQYLYRSYGTITQKLTSMGLDNPIYISPDNSKNKLQFSREIPKNPALSLQKI